METRRASSATKKGGHEFVLVERKKKPTSTPKRLLVQPPSLNPSLKEKLLRAAYKSANTRIQGQLIEKAKAQARMAAMQKEGGQVVYIRRGRASLMIVVYKADLTNESVRYGAATFNKGPYVAPSLAPRSFSSFSLS